MGLLGILYEWARIHAEKDELNQLTDKELKDIGLHQYVVEGLKPRMFGS